MVIYLWIMFARNRGQLQERLGQPVETAGNCLLYFPAWFAYCAPCALCQEGRAIKAAWQRNGMVPITPQTSAADERRRPRRPRRWRSWLRTAPDRLTTGRRPPAMSLTPLIASVLPA